LDTLAKSADKVMLFTYIAKHVVNRNGRTVTFMPKPLFGDNGACAGWPSVASGRLCEAHPSYPARVEGGVAVAQLIRAAAPTLVVPGVSAAGFRLLAPYPRVSAEQAEEPSHPALLLLKHRRRPPLAE
jgi:hypothetical protein